MKFFSTTTRYRASMLVVMVMLLQVLTPMIGDVVWAAEVDVIDSVEITNEQVQDGFRSGDKVRIDVTWSIKSDVKEGDTFTFGLPEELRGFCGTIDLKDSNGNNFGTGVGSGDMITFTFTDNVEKFDDISGLFYVESQIECMEQQGEITVPLKFTVNGEVIEVDIIVDTGTDTGGNNEPIDRMFGKWGFASEEETNIIDWIMEVNVKREYLADITITDEIGEGHELVEGSIRLYNYTKEEWLDLPDGVKSFTSSKNGFSIELYDYGEMYLVYYKTEITDSTKADFTNKATLSAWNREPIEIETEAEIFGSGGGASGELKKYKGQLKVIKQDKETEEPLEGARFKLFDDTGELVGTLITDVNGQAITEEIPGGVYTLEEIEAPEGYVIDGDPQEITLDFKENNIVEKVIPNNKIEPIIEKTEVTVMKVWEGGPTPRPNIDIQLYRNGEAYGSPVTLSDGETEYTWADLDLTDENGEAYTYTVDELEISEGYEKSLSEDNLTIINTYVEPEEPAEPEEPEEPEESEEPAEPEVPEPIKPTKPEDPATEIDSEVPSGDSGVEKTETLPKTGENNNIFFYLIGLILITLGIGFRRKMV